ncbi:MAG: protein tyrosine phosphatase family protein [Candidatus Poribacteria bacterium]|nr:protein tyrosine phosphatase family protein [Candidatus Poribacteria bacterium]
MMKRSFVNFAVVSLVMVGFLITGCTNKTNSTEKTEAIRSIAALETVTLGNTPNVHKFGNIYFAGQPSNADFAEVKKAGVKTVINLRMPKELSFDEKRVVEDLGMSYHNIGFRAPDTLTDQRFGELRSLLSESENQPILLHCGSANRVGAIWLAYRVLEGGLSDEAALAEAKTIGLRSKELEDKAKDYIERHKQ